MSDILLAGQASIWAQPDGPNTKPEYLGCHAVDSIEDPGGDLTRVYCPDPAKAGAYRVAGSFQGEPGVPTATITGAMGILADWLEDWPCTGNVFVHKVMSGRRDSFTNRVRSFLLWRATKTGDTLNALASRTPGDEAETTQDFSFSAEELVRIYRLTSARQSIAATANLLAVGYLNEERCADDDGPAIKLGQYGVTGGEGAVAAEAALYITTDGGATWAAAAADPFAVDEDISAVAMFLVGVRTPRILVARGTTDAGAPAEVAYSDDLGATWTTADVGAVNAHFLTRSGALFALDVYNIWLGTNLGYLFKSEDGGETWTAQEEGTITATAWHVVRFLNSRVGAAAGAANAIALTEDGGVSWSPITGPAGKAADAITAMELVSRQRMWVGYDDGELYYTHDGGDTWAQRTFPGSGTGTVQGLHFSGEMIGWMLHESAAPLGGILRTIDGGYTWEPVQTPANAGLISLAGIHTNDAAAVGDVSGTTPVVARVFAG